MAGCPEDKLLMAATGLEGGMVGSGSTCGIVSAGALGIALMHRDRLDSAEGKAAVFDKIRRQVDWHKHRFGTTLCRERTRVDFHTFGGQFRYFVNPARFTSCFFDIGSAVSRIHATQDTMPSVMSTGAAPIKYPKNPVHCAEAVLAGIRKRTGVGDPLLESLAFVFDGGLGLSGNVCGAAAGAVMAANLVFGVNSRTLGRKETVGKFLIGHLNLFAREKRRMPEPFGIGRIITDELRNAAGALECRKITGRDFADTTEFQAHLAESTACQALIDQAIATSSEVIKTWQSIG